MAKIVEIPKSEAREHVAVTASEMQVRVYMQMLDTMRGTSTAREITPDEGETLRAIKMGLTHAANRSGLKDYLKVGETNEKTLVVWLEDQPIQRRVRRQKPAEDAPAKPGIRLIKTTADGGEEITPIDMTKQAEILNKNRQTEKESKPRRRSKASTKK